MIPVSCGRQSADSYTDPGEMVYYGETTDIRGFDPAKAGDVASGLAIGKVYEGLLQYSYLYRPYRVEPSLAERLPEVSDDGLTYTFKLRRGVFYQDDPCFTNNNGKGRELTAQDFVYSIKRIADVKNQSTGYWAFNDRIEGLDEFRNITANTTQTDYDLPVEGLRAPDDRTLVIKLKSPYPQLLWILTMHYAFAVPREAVEYYGAEFLNHPVGTGPYIVKAWRRNYRIEYERNPKWSETGREVFYPSDGAPGDKEEGLLDDAGKRLPFYDRIVQYVIDDASTQWLKFVAGEIESSGISRDNWDAVLTREMGLGDKLQNLGVRLFTTPTLDIAYLGFNMDDPVVGGNPGRPGMDPDRIAKNRKLRQAITCAFNSTDWIRFWNGRVSRAKGPIPPGVAGYAEDPTPYPFDLGKAKTLLAEAGYPDGIDPSTGTPLSLTMDIGSAADADVRQSVELTVAFLKEIGVKLTANYNNWPAFLSKMERRQCQLYRLAWVADYPDAENFLQLFYGPNSSPGPNHSNYINPEFDVLYEKIRVMPDCAERTDLYKQMARIVIEDCPWVFMHHGMAYGLHHSWVQNYKPHDFPYGMEKFKKVDTQKRSAWKFEHGNKSW